MQSILIVIPSRFASTRFPGKPLVQIHGKSMLARVWNQANLVNYANKNIVIATDDDRIVEEAKSIGANYILTSSLHESGTDRVFEAAHKSGISYDILVNLQGDEPFVDPLHIQTLIDSLVVSNASIATLKTPIYSKELVDNPNIVKVVCNTFNHAMYFSRSNIPFAREGSAVDMHFKHIGLYAFKKEVVPKLQRLAVCKLEETEKLEQLRWLYAGFDIVANTVVGQSLAVDSPADLLGVEKYLKDNPHFI
jgi:3-deoxy-manno-octulosonate cytidylyltransferase (CMP-KDO synthetase)